MTQIRERGAVRISCPYWIFVFLEFLEVFSGGFFSVEPRLDPRRRIPVFEFYNALLYVPFITFTASRTKKNECDAVRPVQGIHSEIDYLVI